MSIDHREKERTSAELSEGVVPRPTQRTPRWPFVATAIVLAMLLAVSVLVLTQSGGPQEFPYATDVAAGGMTHYHHTTLEAPRGAQEGNLNTSILEGSRSTSRRR